MERTTKNNGIQSNDNIKHGTWRKTGGDNESRQLLKCETPYIMQIINLEACLWQLFTTL